MDFYFVYSSGGGAGDWNGVNRMWNQFMPDYFKENLLIKFGDISSYSIKVEYISP